MDDNQDQDNHSEGSDGDVDTLGLAWDSEANRGGAGFDTASTVVSAITAPTTRVTLNDNGNDNGGVDGGGGKVGAMIGLAAPDTTSVAISAITDAPTRVYERTDGGAPTSKVAAAAPTMEMILENESTPSASASAAGAGITKFSSDEAVSSTLDEEIAGQYQATSSEKQEALQQAAAVSITTGDPLPLSTQSESSPSVVGAFRVNPNERSMERASSASAQAQSNNDLSAGNTNISSQGNNQTEGEQQGNNITTTSENNHEVAAEAYLVEEGTPPPSAIVVQTCFGVERKRLGLICAGGFAVLVIVLGSVLGVLIPRARQNNENTAGIEEPAVCGPLCELDSSSFSGETEEEEEVRHLLRDSDRSLSSSQVSDPERVVFGKTCEEWNTESGTLNLGVNDTETCEEKYLAQAYGCGCQGMEPPVEGCGSLCSDGSELPMPDLVVNDINGVEMSCKDWQLMAQFDTDPQECGNYNAIGVLCGCTGNEPHPEACGSLCGEGKVAQAPGITMVWNKMCRDWNTLSKFLPSWYNNEAGETCQEYYQDVAFGCGCEGMRTPPNRCGKLCKDRRTCKSLCQDGSEIPEPNLIVKRDSCAGWEYAARTEVAGRVCPLFPMAGAMCGCNNEPPSDTCGPLCGPNGGLPPDLNKVVRGQTCEEWNYSATYLPKRYGIYLGRSCTDFYDSIAYNCGCQGFEPPTNGCGMLCEDGSPLPDPSLTVTGKACGDIEVSSLFQVDPLKCSSYRPFGNACGCPSTIVAPLQKPCFKLEYLEGQTYSNSESNILFSASFGDDGMFTGVNGNGESYNFGYFRGIEDNVAKFGGGASCGLYGLRSGYVVIVEDPSLTQPSLSYVSSKGHIPGGPAYCLYKAELRVPQLCS